MNQLVRKHQIAFAIIVFFALLFLGLCTMSVGYPLYMLGMFVFFFFTIIFSIIVDIFIYPKTSDPVEKRRVQLYLPLSIGLFIIIKTLIGYFPDGLMSILWFAGISFAAMLISYLPTRYSIMKNYKIIYSLIFKYAINLGIIIYTINYYSGMLI